MLWRDYFPFGTIVGIDIKLPRGFQPTERIHLFQGSQDDRQFLSRLSNEIAPHGFDIIIDDASHIGELTKIAFWHLFDNHLKPNGLYVIEDWGTGYWSDWPDGKALNLEAYLEPSWMPSLFLAKIARKLDYKWMRSLFLRRIAGRLHFKRPFRCHSYGMVGFIKQVVDELGARGVTREQRTGKSNTRSRLESMTITPGIVFVRKADNQPQI